MEYYARTVDVETGEKRMEKQTDVLPIKFKSLDGEVKFFLHQSMERYGRWSISEDETGLALVTNEETMLEAIQKLIEIVSKIGIKKIIGRKKELSR